MTQARRSPKVTITLSPTALESLDAIAAANQEEAGEAAPNRSRAVAELIADERRRREKRAERKSTDA